MSVPDASTVALSRRLVRSAERAVLGTLAADGSPYASLVLVATSSDGTPLLLLSELAEHTRNLRRDPRASLLVDGTAGHADPLTGPRLTLQGTASPVDESGCAAARARFLARYSGAAVYAGFADFHFWRIVVERGHLVAGFGRIIWLPAEAIRLSAAAGPLAAAEAGIVAHMNDDHADAVDLYAQCLLGRGGGGWRMIAIDPEGCDLRRGGETIRLDFAEPVRDADAARRELVRLVGVARERRSGAAPS